MLHAGSSCVTRLTVVYRLPFNATENVCRGRIYFYIIIYFRDTVPQHAFRRDQCSSLFGFQGTSNTTSSDGPHETIGCTFSLARLWSSTFAVHCTFRFAVHASLSDGNAVSRPTVVECRIRNRRFTEHAYRFNGVSFRRVRGIYGQRVVFKRCPNTRRFCASGV